MEEKEEKEEKDTPENVIEEIPENNIIETSDKEKIEEPVEEVDPLEAEKNKIKVILPNSGYYNTLE